MEGKGRMKRWWHHSQAFSRSERTFMHRGKGKELAKTEDAAEEDRPRGGRRQGVCLPGRTSLSSCQGPLGPPVRQLLLMPCEEGHALSLSGSPPGLGALQFHRFAVGYLPTSYLTSSCLSHEMGKKGPNPRDRRQGLTELMFRALTTVPGTIVRAGEVFLF